MQFHLNGFILLALSNRENGFIPIIARRSTELSTCEHKSVNDGIKSLNIYSFTFQYERNIEPQIFTRLNISTETDEELKF